MAARVPILLLQPSKLVVSIFVPWCHLLAECGMINHCPVLARVISLTKSFRIYAWNLTAPSPDHLLSATYKFAAGSLNSVTEALGWNLWVEDISPHISIFPKISEDSSGGESVFPITFHCIRKWKRYAKYMRAKLLNCKIYVWLWWVHRIKMCWEQRLHFTISQSLTTFIT